MAEKLKGISRYFNPKITGFVLLAILLFAASRYFPIGQYLETFLQYIRDLGFPGYLLFVLAYILATVLFVPGTILTLGAGAVFGLVGGTIAVSAGSTLGAAAAFLVGRFIARDAIAERVKDNPRFAAIDKSVQREGFKIVFLTRLSPIFPFNLLNYAYGLTRVRLSHYIIASWIGMIPGTILYVYIGATAESLATAGSDDTGGVQLAIQIVGLVATIIVTVVITRIARRSLKEATEMPPESETP